MPSTFLAVSFVACLLASSVSGFAPASLAMSANIPAAGKKFDILLYGATGFTGKLVAAYLDKAMELSGPGASDLAVNRFALVGTDVTVRTSRKELGDRWKVRRQVAHNWRCADDVPTRSALALAIRCPVLTSRFRHCAV